MKNLLKIHSFIVLLILTACGRSGGFITEQILPPIYPDYAGVTIPVNIAPLNFMVSDASGLRVNLSVGAVSINLKGRGKIRIPMRKWRTLLDKAVTLEEDITVSVLAKMQGKWHQYLPFSWHVTRDSIDPFLSYRLIEPGYEVWKTIQLAERHSESFRERIIADNQLTGNNCMNCHTYGNQDPALSFFHLRGPGGGTVLNRNGVLRKIDLFTQGMLSGVVYGNFHPSGRYAVYSTNLVLPGFHTKKGERLEVYDSGSDLVVVDLDLNQVIPFPEDFPHDFRTFPVFSASGDAVYYCNAPRIT
ncbi:MAG: hypothetical protein PHT64_07370, partial [Bacteroidales bacterium]|nr:hypothetical protein [Bacteroidales bacterium]